MRSLTILAALLGAVSAAPSLISRAAPTFSIAKPGGVKDIVITAENTLNGTFHSKDTTTVSKGSLNARALSGHLPIQIVNNFSGNQVYAYITGLDSDNRVVFVAADGSLVYPSSGGSGVPVPISAPVSIALPSKGNSITVTLPIVITSARVYFSEGNLQFFMVKIPTGDGLVQPSVTNLADPSAGINWGFVELTYTSDKAVYANISFVDFVGMILSMSLSTTDGSGTQTTKALTANAVSQVCQGLSQQSSVDGYPWSSMCIANSAGTPIRVLSPNDYAVINSAAFQNYWSPYVDQVWSKYTSTPLTVNTQGYGNVNCQVSGTTLNCNGDNRSYSKPTAADIWGCNSGPFGKLSTDNNIHLAVIPRLCAAFVRSTLLIAGGNVQPSVGQSQYYTVSPTNHYSRLVHQLEVDGKGYTFPYDDVNPDGENASGLLSSGAPNVLTLYVGAPPS
ncbi:glycoside hydrolase family 64 [Trichoderma cornu-damae]|uniref:Glycoside hydrolase family 64 n=1 Tax=Trichoderma cornu-damae TaxID=654480 RepID=A0A9P8QHT2_9HYPO|nr:glycoside hydrolase family 64 [Trichoderma cornu-damae]